MQHKKNIQGLIAGLVTVMVVLWACRPDELKPFTTVGNGNASQLAGTWNGLSVTQRDIGSENKNFPYKSQDITSALQFNAVKLTLNGTTSGSFNITYGAAPAFFKFNSGNWSVDDVSKVGKVYLVNGVDSIVLVMGSYSYLVQNKLLLKQTKTLLGSPAIVYEFMFSK